LDRKKVLRILLISLGVLALAFIGCIVLIYTNISKIWEKPIVDSIAAAAAELDPEISGLPSYHIGEVKPVEQTEGTMDILLIGVDNRRSEFTGLSDVMILLRVDKDKNVIKLASFMRDTYVPIDGHNTNKLNTAFSMGSIELTEKTFEQNFGITPDHYIIINFYGMEDIIEAFKGVDVNINKGQELEWLNININEINKEDSKHTAKNINKSGEHHLNGRQAVAYMRIRHPDFDAGRIERQHTVLSQLFSKAQNLGIGDLAALVDASYQYVRTDIPLGEILDIAKTVKGITGGLKTFRYPEDYDNPTIEGAGSIVLPKDFETEMKKLKDFLEN
jgi:LCP family protein required for cell wall assembly